MGLFRVDAVRRADGLPDIPLFAGLSDAARGAFATKVHLLRVAPGMPLFLAGERPDAVYLVTRGALKAVTSTQGGTYTSLVVMSAGSILGEVLSPAASGQPEWSATAIVDSEVAALDRADLLELIERYGEIGISLLKVIAQQFRAAEEVLKIQFTSDVPSRVARAVLQLASQIGTKDIHDGLSLDHGLTQNELALLIGASRERVNRTLADFVQHGWLTTRPRAMVIHDEESLRRRATADHWGGT